MRSLPRRTATRVVGGRVLRKNNWAPSPTDYWSRPPGEIEFDRWRPAEGYRHVISVAQMRTYLELLPDWDQIATGLRAVVFADDTHCDGWYAQGVVALCNWPRALWERGSPEFIAEHAELLERLDVEIGPLQDGAREVRWTEEQARAYLLLHVFPHELGHHHDRMTTAGQTDVPRGESYAETYANRALDALWPAYTRAFPI